MLINNSAQYLVLWAIYTLKKQALIFSFLSSYRNLKRNMRAEGTSEVIQHISYSESKKSNISPKATPLSYGRNYSLVFTT